MKDLEAKREGVSEGVKSVLRQREQKFSFVRGLVADIVRVDVEHAHVIEAALDGRDQWLVTDDAVAAAEAEDALGDLEGRVNVVCTDRVAERGAEPEAYDWNAHPQRIRLASDLVRVEPRDAFLARHLLGRTVVADDLDTAVDLHKSGPKGWRYATYAGEVIEPDGTLRAGPLTAAMGIISRRSELEAIAQQVAEVEGRIATLGAQLSEGNTVAKELEGQQNALRNDIYRANTTKVELTSKVAQNGDKQASLRREEPLLERELDGLAGQLEKLMAEAEALAEKRQGLEGEQAERQGQVDASGDEQQRLSEELRRTGEELTAARVEVGQAQEKQLAARQQVQRMTAGRAELQQQVERIARNREGVAGRREGVETELEAAREAEIALSEKQSELTGQIESLAGRVTDANEAVVTLSGAVERIREAYAEIEQALHGLQLKHGETRVRLETLVQRTLEELQLDLPAKYAALHAPLEDGTPGPGYQPADIDWDGVGNEIKQLRERINRLGNVNLDAIGEMEELEKREGFLTTQVTDLTDSKRQLEELIDTINLESGVRFEQTFTAVREHFQNMFRKLFGGGKADIFLELESDEAPPVMGPDGQPLLPMEKKKFDILDAGIEIMAHPPGKKPVSISQLSGGEKTMTCVALLMSIFKSKPSPFCILDEVDAALDEANNQRFNLIVQEFLEQSQFIVITHSKRTMQIADVLYGVTMQEQGVSKRVAVKFDQVDNQGRISDSAAA